MTFSLFLNNLPELYLNYCSEPLECYHTLSHFSVLCVLIFFCFLVKVLLTRIFCTNERTHKCHRGRTRRRRKGGTHRGCRHYQREQEDKRMLISLIKSPLGQSHDSILFRQLLCPDPSCEVCNNATAEMGQLLSSLALEDATPSASPLASAAPVTEPTVPPGALIPPLPEPLPPAPSNFSANPVTTLDDFSSPLSAYSLPPQPFPSLESEFAMDSSPPLPLVFPSFPPHDTQSVETPTTVKTIFLDHPVTQDINTFQDLAQTLNPTPSVMDHGPSALSVLPPPDHSLTDIQPESITISPKPALENSSPDSTGALSTHVPPGTDHPSLSISDLSCKDAHVKDPLPSTLAQCDVNQVKDVGYDAEKDLNSYMMSLSGANLTTSGQSMSQRQSENALKVHLSKKFNEIYEGQLPVAVHSSLLVIQQTLPVQSHTETKQGSLAPSVSRECCLNTCQELCFLETSAQQTLDAHITKFNLRMMYGLPAKVLESIECSKLRNNSSHFLYYSKCSSSNKVISEVDSKSGGFTALQGSPNTLTHPHPATSLVDKEGQEIMRPSPSEIAQGLAEEGRRTPGAGQTSLPVTNIIGKASREIFPRANIHPPELPISQSGAGHEPKNQRVNGSQGKKMKSEILTTVTTESLPAKTSALQGPKLADLQTQLMAELEKLEKRKHSQAQGQLTHMPQASDSLTCKASLTHAQGVSSVDGAAPQVLHVHVEDRGVRMEQAQEPWIPRNISSLCQRKNFPPAAKKVSPTGSKSEELGGGDAGLGTSQPGKMGLSTRGAPLKRLGAKSPQTPSQKAQTPPESLFRNQMNRFFQWLHPGTKCKKQGHSQEKGSPISSVQNRGPVKSRAAFTRLFREEKLGRRHAVTCPQQSLPSAVKSGKAQQKAGVRAQAEPAQGHPSNSRAPFCKVTYIKYFYQAAVFHDKGGHPQKVVALKDQLLCQKHPQSVPRRGTVPCSRPTCRHPAALWPPAALATAGGTMFRDPSNLCRQKSILANLQGKEFPTPK